MTETVTLTLSPVTPAALKRGTDLVAKYRADGGGSNRTKWERLETLCQTACAAKTLRAGHAVEVTALFPGDNYHVVHRALSTGPLRDLWASVQVVSLVDCVDNGDTVTGVSDTKSRQARHFICPTK